MKSKHQNASLAMLVSTLLMPAMAAANTPHDLALGVGIGTEGISGQITGPLIPRTLNLSLGFSRFEHNFSFQADDARFGAGLRLGSVPVVLSWYPWHGNVSVDAGLVFNQNRVSSTAVPDAGGTYTINGNTYTASQVGTLAGATHFNAVAPYAGIGWGNPLAGGAWTFMATAGAMYEGSPRITLEASGAGTNPKLANDVNAARIATNSKLDFLNWWPVLTIGVDYRFP